MAQIIFEVQDEEESDARQILRDALGEFGAVRGQHRDGGYEGYVARRYPSFSADPEWAADKVARVQVRCRMADRMKNQT